jgi:hypothetical protein
LTFNRGAVVDIEAAERRQSMSFHQTLREAKIVVTAMTEEQVSNYVACWFRQEIT